MKRSVKKVEKRGKQNLIINLVIGIAVIFLFSIVFFDSFKSEKTEKVVVSREKTESKAQTLEIPRKETPKPKIEKEVKNQDYKKYQSYFEEGKEIDEGSFDNQSAFAIE